MTRISSFRVERATKVFGAVRALINADLEVKPGEVVAIMGPNGAGKSTLLNIISMTMRPTRGKLFINDKEIVSGVSLGAQGRALRGRVGLLSHQPLIYPELTGRENLKFFAKLNGMDNIDGRVIDMEKKMAIEPFADDRPSRVLSRGQLQRVALARALISDPDLLLLDEPAAGLDSSAVDRIRDVINSLKERNGMAVMVTHEPEVAAKVATRAVMVRGGKVVVDQPALADAQSWRKLYLETVEGEGGK